MPPITLRLFLFASLSALTVASDDLGIGTGDTVGFTDNPLDCPTQAANVTALTNRGVNLNGGC